jgi:hypothetical protein
MRGGFDPLHRLPPARRRRQADGEDSTETCFRRKRSANEQRAEGAARCSRVDSWEGFAVTGSFCSLHLHHITQMRQKRVMPVKLLRFSKKSRSFSPPKHKNVSKMKLYKYFCVFLKKVRFFSLKYGNI